MIQLINSLESSLKNKNWHSALLVALTLPDIAGKIEYPISSSLKRYSSWFTKYVGDNYKYSLGAPNEEHVFLSGNDCYALRCAYLHEGTTNIRNQSAKDVIDDFIFVEPKEGLQVHCNQLNDRLQLQVDTFCTDIIRGLYKWNDDISRDPIKREKLKNLIQIHIL